MGTQFDTGSLERGADSSNTLAAVYSKEEDAREAVKELHKAGLKKTWLGVTKASDDGTGEPLVEQKGLAFFNADRLTLHRALVQRGVSDRQAQELERSIAPGCAVVTVYGEDDPGGAARILATRGRVIESDWNPPSRPASDLTAGATSARFGDEDDDEDEFVYGRAERLSAGAGD